MAADFRGVAIWDNDPLESPHLGLEPLTEPKILIYGAADRALEDFLRITTGLPSPAHLLTARHLPAPITDPLKDMDRIATHGFLWGRGPVDDHAWHV